MRKFLGGLVIFVALFLSFDAPHVAHAQTNEDSGRALLLFEDEVSAAGDALRDLDEWAIQHITVTGLTETQRMIDDRSDRLPNHVVLAAGRTDSADLDGFEAGADAIVSALDGVDNIIWLDFPELRDRDQAANKILRELARENTALRVLSWNGAQRSITAYESASGELTPDGTAAMASLITSELRGRSVGLASGPLFQTATTTSTSTTTTAAPATTTTTTAPSTTTTTTSTSTTTTSTTTDSDTESAETADAEATSSTYLTTTTTSAADGEQSIEATESALSALEDAERRTASLTEGETDGTSTSEQSPSTETLIGTNEQATGVGDVVGVGEPGGGRGLRQLGAFLFTFVIAGIFLAIRRNEFEPYDGRRPQEPDRPW